MSASYIDMRVCVCARVCLIIISYIISVGLHCQRSPCLEWWAAWAHRAVSVGSWIIRSRLSCTRPCVWPLLTTRCHIEIWKYELADFFSKSTWSEALAFSMVSRFPDTVKHLPAFSNFRWQSLAARQTVMRRIKLDDPCGHCLALHPSVCGAFTW